MADLARRLPEVLRLWLTWLGLLELTWFRLLEKTWSYPASRVEPRRVVEVREEGKCLPWGEAFAGRTEELGKKILRSLQR